MPAEVLTFQKWSFNNYVSFFSIFFEGVGHILAIVQQAALLIALSLSLRHFKTASEAEVADGWPIFPSSSKAISLRLEDLLFR